MARLPDFTQSGEANPPFSEAAPLGGALYSKQVCYLWTNGVRSALPNYTDNQLWTPDTVRKRHGNQSIRCTSFHDGYGPYKDTSLGMIVYLNEQGLRANAVQEGDDEWVGFSMFFEAAYNGSLWALCEPFASVHQSEWPVNGYGFTTPTPTTFTLDLKVGKIAPTGGNPVAPPLGYAATEYLLGTTGMPPFTKGVWLDFYYYCRYNATSAGILEIWYREQGQAFQKLYSNRNDGTAKINRAPHPTWVWTDSNGVPNGHGTKSFYRIYRGSGAPQNSMDVRYWSDAWMRRQSDTALLAEFAAMDNPLAPTVSSFAPTSGTAGVTSVVIAGTNFTGATQVLFNGVPASFVVDSSIQITATCPTGSTTGKILVTTPQGSGQSATDFTVGATLPPTLPDPALNNVRVGNTAFDTYSTGALLDTKRVIRRGVGAGNTVAINKIYALLTGPTSGGTAQCRAVVHDDDGTTALPGTLRGVSDDVTVALNASAAWVEFPFSTPAQVVGDQFYFGLHYGGLGSVGFGYVAAAGQGWRGSDVFAGGASNPFGANPVVIGVEPGLVADYTTAGDTQAPSFISASVNTDTLLMSYDEDLDPASVPAPTDFFVEVNQAPWPINSVSLGGATIALDLGINVAAVDIVTVGYSQPFTGRLQDVAGNSCASISGRAVLNQTDPIVGLRRIDAASRTAVARRIDATARRTGEGGGI